MSAKLRFPCDERVRRQLERALDTGQLAGAYLFEGAPGAGQEQVALELAAWIIAGSTDPADAAASRVLRFTHPDLLLVQALVPGKAASEMKEDDWLDLFRQYQGRRVEDPLVLPEFRTNPRISIFGMRGVRQELGTRPFEGRGRAVILRDAEVMEKEAQDALLKTLEEPPSNTLLVLISYRPESLNPTILSRCQRLPFEPLDRETVAGILCERGLEPARAEFLAGLADGDLEEAVRLAAAEGEEGNVLLERREAWFDLLDRCELGSEADMIDAVREVATRKKGDSKNPTALRAAFLAQMMSWYRDLLRTPPGEPLRVHGDQERRRERYAGLEPWQLAERLQRCEKARGQILGYVNAPLTLASFFLSVRGRKAS